MKSHTAMSALAAMMLIAGCKVGPDYAQPEMALTPQFDNVDTPGYSPDAVESAWWTSFEDPLLTRLIELAYRENHDLRMADANLREVRELLEQARMDLYPVVPATARYDRFRASTSAAPGLDTDARTTGLFFTGFDAFWELDVYGRVRRAIEARRAEVEGFEALYRDVMVLVSAEVARNYFELRGAQDRLGVALRNAENQKSTYDLTVSLLNGGRGTELDTARARAQYESTLAMVPLLEAAVRQAMYRIGVLTGQDPQALISELEAAQGLPPMPERVAIGDPQALVQRRADILAAERRLASATAQIGVETADLFPRVTFAGSFGLEGQNVGDLVESGAGAFSFGPRLHWAAFDLGRVRAQIRAAGARADAALANYEVTVLEALEEVDARLVQYHGELVRTVHLENANTASRTAADLARKRYQQGVTDFLTVLDAERRQLEAEDLLADSRTRSATALVGVYKALGGGWNWTAPEPAGDASATQNP